MLLSVSIVRGFQEEVRGKVIGFGSHIRITPIEMSSDAEHIGVLINQPFLSDLMALPAVKHVQSAAVKPAILQAPTDTTFDEDGGKTVHYSIHGIMVRGAGEDFDWRFFSDKLIDGRLPDKDSAAGNDVLISAYIANILHLQPGTDADVYFIKSGNPVKRRFHVCGIYKTGLEDFDQQIVFVHMHHVQELNDWGVQAFLSLKDTCWNGNFVLEATAKGGGGAYLYDWGEGWTDYDAARYCPQSDTVVRVVVAGYTPVYGKMPAPETLPDTAWLSISPVGAITCNCGFSDDEAIPADYGEDGFYRKLNIDAEAYIETRLRTSGGSHRYYTNAFEVQLNNWEDLQSAQQVIRDAHIGPGFQSQTIMEQHPDIFSWLALLDINVIIILSLVMVVSIVNMSSSMLVLILERTNAIGILKAMGAGNWMLRKVFLWHASWLAGLGLISGNMLAIGFIVFQQQTGFFTLNEDAYFLAAIPAQLNWKLILVLNLVCFLICVVALLLPSWLITRISPVKAVRFQ